MTTLTERGPDPRFHDGRGSGCSLIERTDERLTVARIVSLVAASFHIQAGDITSDRRMKSIVWPRHVSAWLARHTLPLSLPVIGRALGGRDHSTVMHALERVDGRRATDPVFRAQTDALRVACEQLPGALREISHAG